MEGVVHLDAPGLRPGMYLRLRPESAPRMPEAEA